MADRNRIGRSIGAVQNIKHLEEMYGYRRLGRPRRFPVRLWTQTCASGAGPRCCERVARRLVLNAQANVPEAVEVVPDVLEDEDSDDDDVESVATTISDSLPRKDDDD